ncbi:MAG: PilN domain-containing protein [Gammaproteobacteria bacterium]
MSRINLLPWREARRKELQNQFISAVGVAAVLGAIVWGIGHFYHTQLMENQLSRNAYLDQQISLLDKKIKEIKELEKEKERLLARMRAIEQLQGNRPLIVRFFDEVVNNLPEGVSVISLKQTGQSITIKGVAQSNARVSSFMRNLESSEWLKNPKLDVIQTKSREGGLQLSNFTLRFSQVIPRVGEGEEDA